MNRENKMDPYLETISTFDRQASAYQQKYMNVAHYADGLNYLLTGLGKDAAVLEIGCGPGNVTMYLLDKRTDLRVTAVDAAAGMLSLARENVPTADFLLMDAREIGQINNKFDAIICAFLLPYLADEDSERLLSDCYYKLKPDGHFYISTMEDEYSKSGYRYSSDGKDRCYMYFYTADDLQKKLSNSGFTVRFLKRQPFPPNAMATATDLIIIAAKNE